MVINMKKDYEYLEFLNKDYLEIVESKELFKNNSMNLIRVSKEGKKKLETLKKKRSRIKLEIEKKKKKLRK